MARRRRDDPNQLAFDIWNLDDLPDPAPAPAPVEVPVQAADDLLFDLDTPEPAAPAPIARPATRPTIEPPPIPRATPSGPPRRRQRAIAERATPSERVRRGVDAARVLKTLEQEQRQATSVELDTLRAWPGWGAVPELFNERSRRFAAERAELREMWTDAEWSAAARTTINAHYTDPAIVAPMWEMLRELGLQSGTVLEPGSGSGNFLGRAPAGVHMVGIELDPTSAAISRHLHPDARVHTESFADTRLHGDGFDAVIGNVPFADVQLHDPVYNPDRFTMHNHFIVKSVAMTKPGGLVAVLTSRWTMDAKNPHVRERLAEHVDLVGAVRLPTGAHRATAGTEVVTDLLILRRRLPGEPASDTTWVHADPVMIGEHTVTVNRYFTKSPDLVLGEFSTRSGMYGIGDLSVNPADLGALPEQLEAACARIVDDARTAGLVWTAGGQRAVELVEGAASRALSPIGEFSVEDGNVWIDGIDGRVVFDGPTGVARELDALVGLRDAAVALLDAESDLVTEPDVLDALRVRLNEVYDRYVAAHGPVNRVELIARPAKGEDGEDTVRRRYPPAIVAFRQDPHAATVAALEVFDEESQEAVKADIFRRRVVGAEPPTPAIQSIDDALAVVLDRTATVNVDEIARLRGISVADAREQLLVELAFVDQHDPDRLVRRAEYLSGNVRAKLRAAEAAAGADPRFDRNVEALKAVQPKLLGPAEIDVRFGATWVPGVVYADYLEQLTGAKVDVGRPGGDKWNLKFRGAPPSISRATRIAGPDMALNQFLLRVMNNGKLVIEREDSEGKKYIDADATEVLQEKAQALVDDFQSWVWTDADRAEKVVTLYNDRFNAIVLRNYDDVRLTLPGKAESFEPRPHQHAAVARMIEEPSTGLFHEVGAGKTAEMIMGTMELRRLGLSSRPAIVVPNHVLDQFAREFKQIYPAARVLVTGSEDVSTAGGRDGRRLFVKKAQTGDWDAIIISRSAFVRIGLSPEYETAWLRRKLDAERARLQLLQNNDLGKTWVKGQEKAMLALEERLKRAIDMPRDHGVSFEATGIDYLCIDEAHGYKNLAVQSSFEDLAKPVGSRLATDLEMKLDYVRNTLGRTRVVTLATATPVANGLQEMYVMQRYLRPDVLKDAGIDSADDWARQFTQEVRAPEVGPAGDLRMKTRIGKFRNMPELLRLFHIAGDVKTARDLNLPVPLLAPLPDGRRAPRVVLVPKNDGTKQFQEQLKTRAEAIRGRIVDPRDDNMLSLSSDARLAALDLRLLDSAWEYDANTTSKADLVVREVMRVHQASADTEYRDVFGRTHSTRGGLQIVFCDRGTPGDKFNMYDEVKAGLVAAGMSPRAIRYIHEANTDLEKAALFKACRDGEVSVIIGSTEKMGTGTNIQTRVTALHHIDCPWRPADIVQREGRGIRQGNQNPEIEILRYVQQGSFDAYMWQTVTRKAAAFEQIMAGTSEARDYELDPSEDVQNMVEAATGGIDDPRVMERITLANTIKRLKSLERGFHRENAVTKARLRDVIGIRDGLNGQLPHLDAIRAERRDTAGDSFTGYCTHGTATRALPTNERTRFGLQVQAAVEQFHTAWYQPSMIPTATGIIATVGGVSFAAKSYRHTTTNRSIVRFDLTRLDPYGYARRDAELGTEMSVTFELDEIRGALPSAIAQRFEHRVNGLREHDRAVRAKVSSLVEEETLIRQTADQPWPRATEMAEAEARLADLVETMRRGSEPTSVCTARPTAPLPSLNVEISPRL